MAVAAGVLKQILYQQLSGGGYAVYADIAPAGIARPYLVFFVAAGGESNRRRVRDAEFVVTVKCVSNDGASAYTGAAYIETMLNDHGSQDTTPLSATNEDWDVTTITQDRVIDQVEMYEQAAPVYHAGHQYQVVMEARN
jgi:hypothetical protein